MNETALQAAKIIAERAPALAPRVGLVLGSGLGDLAEEINEAIAIPYSELDGFPDPSIEGHAGRLVAGTWSGVPVLCLQGRVHLYEAPPMDAVSTTVRTLKAAGCEILIVTNAAGSLNPDAGPGSLMLISDHINFMGTNPLIGPHDPAAGPRFFAMDGAYDPALREQMRRAASKTWITLHEGVYLACLGPAFETPAEIEAFRVMGADAVGMSTVPEVIVARQCGLRVVGLSVITNLAAGMGEQPLSHEQTLHHAGLAAADASRLLAEFLDGLDVGASATPDA